jgi:hypothetical protein
MLSDNFSIFARRHNMPEQKRHKINTSHMERLNGTIRGQQARLARRTRNGSHLEEMLQYSTWLWRDLQLDEGALLSAGRPIQIYGHMATLNLR